MYPSYVQGRRIDTAGRSTLDNQYNQKVHENSTSVVHAVLKLVLCNAG